MNVEVWFIITLLIILMFVLFFKIMQLKEILNIVSNLKVKYSGDDSLITGVLFLNYKAVGFQEIDLMLRDYNSKLLIFIDGPKWLIELKTLKWEKHKVISETRVGVLVANKNTLFIFNKMHISKINEVATYLKLT